MQIKKHFSLIRAAREYFGKKYGGNYVLIVWFKNQIMKAFKARYKSKNNNINFTDKQIKDLTTFIGNTSSNSRACVRILNNEYGNKSIDVVYNILCNKIEYINHNIFDIYYENQEEVQEPNIVDVSSENYDPAPEADEWPSIGSDY
jgi:hypothetical protein